MARPRRQTDRDQPDPGFCTACGRVIHRPVTAAHRLAKKLGHQFGQGRVMRVLACPDGNGWHITSEPRKRSTPSTKGARR